MENGIQISKLMQIFSKQAPMIDALISHFSDHMRKKKLEGNASDQFHDGNFLHIYKFCYVFTFLKMFKI